MEEIKIPEAWRVLRIQSELVDGINVCQVWVVLYLYSVVRVCRLTPLTIKRLFSSEPFWVKKVCRLLQVADPVLWRRQTRVVTLRVLHLWV